MFDFAIGLGTSPCIISVWGILLAVLFVILSDEDYGIRLSKKSSEAQASRSKEGLVSASQRCQETRPSEIEADLADASKAAFEGRDLPSECCQRNDVKHRKCHRDGYAATAGK